jgi:hypothetical protein
VQKRSVLRSAAANRSSGGINTASFDQPLRRPSDAFSFDTPNPSPHPNVVPATPTVGGASVIRPGSSRSGDNGMPWETLLPDDASDDWKALAQSVMDTYAARTNGTYILRKSSALSWHYGDADPGMCACLPEPHQIAPCRLRHSLQNSVRCRPRSCRITSQECSLLIQ